MSYENDIAAAPVSAPSQRNRAAAPGPRLPDAVQRTGASNADAPHVVQSGESMSKIWSAAKERGVVSCDFNTFVRANQHISDPNLIRPGDQLLFPKRTSATTKDGVDVPGPKNTFTATGMAAAKPVSDEMPKTDDWYKSLYAPDSPPTTGRSAADYAKLDKELNEWIKRATDETGPDSDVLDPDAWDGDQHATQDARKLAADASAKGGLAGLKNAYTEESSINQAQLNAYTTKIRDMEKKQASFPVGTSAWVEENNKLTKVRTAAGKLLERQQDLEFTLRQFDKDIDATIARLKTVD